MAIVTLENASYRLQVNPALGGSVMRLDYHHKGAWHPLLRPTAPDESNSVHTANFPMVPFSGRIQDSRFHYDGKDVQLTPNFEGSVFAIHGNGWKNAWQVVSHEANRLVLEFDHKAGEWPWDFVSRQEFILDDQGLEHRLSLHNSGASVMPGGLALHPWFPDRDSATVTSHVDSMWAIDENIMVTHTESLPDHWTLQDGMAAKDMACDTFFEGWSGKARITWPEKGIGMDIAEPQCSNLVIYTLSDQDVFCIEPISHGPKAFNDMRMSDADTGRRSLQPAESMAIAMTFRAFAV